MPQPQLSCELKVQMSNIYSPNSLSSTSQTRHLTLQSNQPSNLLLLYFSADCFMMPYHFYFNSWWYIAKVEILHNIFLSQPYNRLTTAATNPSHHQSVSLKYKIFKTQAMRRSHFGVHVFTNLSKEKSNIPLFVEPCLVFVYKKFLLKVTNCCNNSRIVFLLMVAAGNKLSV